ncbi:MAG: hypothetical protein Q8O12_00940 [Candidatus Omnitrophota bacterium]|nr:hypothetical protein [Candidatus Omnitrophota bacterium]
MNTGKLINKLTPLLLILIFISSNIAYSAPEALRIPLQFSAENPNIPDDSVPGSADIARIKEIDALLLEIDKEIEQPGSGNLPIIIAISDYHGEIDLFLRYLADAISQKIGKKVNLNHKKFPQESIEKQLAKQGVDITKIGLRFHLMGDFLDRGSYGIKCSMAAEELVNLGVAEDITGNHDLWAFLNIAGFHLPVYRGYNLYHHFESQKLITEQYKEHKRGILWWTEKLAEYNEAQKEFQEQDLIEGRSISGIREELKEIYLGIMRAERENGAQLLTPEQRKLWQDLAGFYFDTTDVYTGFNGIGMMSVQWWQEKCDAVRKITLQIEGHTEDSVVEIATWHKLNVYVNLAHKAVKSRLQKAINEGKWWWKVFNDINDQNYSSVEWWGKDWSSHAGWGTSVIKELNELDGKNIWNQANYISNPHLKNLASFYRKHFTLYLKDQYGNYYMHGWLPVNMETGEISFIYKGAVYRNEGIWEGLDAIQNDVRDLRKPFSELHEALSLVNSWYADGTTKIKPENIKEYAEKIGIEKIFGKIGIRVLITGHNPLNKLQPAGIGFKVQQGDYLSIFGDKGMNYLKYEDMGAYVKVDSSGIKLRGFNGLPFDKHEVVDNPATIVIKKGEGEDTGWIVQKSWENEPLEKQDFLKIAKKQLAEERARLQKKLGLDRILHESPVPRSL